MRWWGVVSLALLVSLASPLAHEAAGAAKSSRIRPSAHAGEMKLRVSGKTRTYHRATAAEPLEFRIRGPIAVRVLSRYLFEPASADTFAAYALRLEIDGVEVTIGKPKLMADRGLHLPGPFEEEMGSLERQGKTAFLAGWDGATRGVLAVADTVRATAATAVAQLSKDGAAAA